VGTKLRTLLDAAGQDVIMTRSTDVFIELQARADLANSNGADRFVSIHNNSFSDASANGTETYADALSTSPSTAERTRNTASLAMRDRIQSAMISAWGLRNRGGKTANFVVIDRTAMPATLSELGFITNCSADAVALGSATQRQAAAQAHLDALAADLDFGGAAANGTLQGYVVVNDGTPISTTSVRIPGARVSIVGRDDEALGDADGFWSFELPAGTYTVRAEADGYVAAQRTCDPLAANAERFCSVALAAEGEGEGEGEGEEPVGEGEGEGEDPVGEGEGEDPVGEGEGEDPLGEGEGEQPGGEGEGELQQQRIVIRNKPGASGCSCDSSDDNVAALPLVAGMFVLGLRRRRRAPREAMLIAPLLFVVSATAAPTAVVDGTLLEVKRLPLGDVASALPSPAGTQLLVSDARHTGLIVVDIKTGVQRQLDDRDRVGFGARWVEVSGTSSVARRALGEPYGGQPLLRLDAQTGKHVGPFTEHPTHVVVQEHGTILLGRRVDDAGRLSSSQQLSPPGVTCMMPTMIDRRASNDVVVVFQCLGDGVHVRRFVDGGDGNLDAAGSAHLGRGTDVSIAADGRTVAFIRGTDDGHHTLTADVVVVDLDGDLSKVKPVLVRTTGLERGPGVSNVAADGSRVVAFVVDGRDVVVSRFVPVKK
ncbi:MAG TPA: N-acetylmuramoyl-L-alanine amidase, partial [Myxococcota bacterium]